jgi:hypothetical protein
MHLCQASYVMLFGFIVAGCQSPSGPAADMGSPPTFTKDSMTLIGVLRAPATSSVASAPPGEWVIELPKDDRGQVRTAAVDVSDVADRARSLEGKQVSAQVRMPTRADVDTGATAVKVMSLEPK